MKPLRVISIDPGVMTGYTYACISDGLIEVFPFQMTDEVDDLWSRLKVFDPDFIVMEDFEFRGRARTGLILFPVQLIGVARLYEMVGPKATCVLYLQKASEGKGYYTDTLLKKYGVYKRGIPHGMDALRHFMQWVTFKAGHQFVTKPGETKTVLLDEWSERA